MKHTTPIPIYTDSQPLISLTVDLSNATKSRLKSVKPKIQYLKDLIKDKIIVLEWRQGTTNVADLLTKPVHGSQFQKLSKDLLCLPK